MGSYVRSYTLSYIAIAILYKIIHLLAVFLKLLHAHKIDRMNVGGLTMQILQ